MTTVLHILWILLPVSVFLMVLWGSLESWGKKKKRRDLRDFFNQGVFISFCVAATWLIDDHILPYIEDSVITQWIPYSFFRISLLPFILFLGAVLRGPSKEIRISRTQTRK